MATTCPRCGTRSSYRVWCPVCGLQLNPDAATGAPEAFVAYSRWKQWEKAQAVATAQPTYIEGPSPPPLDRALDLIDTRLGAWQPSHRLAIFAKPLWVGAVLALPLAAVVVLASVRGGGFIAFVLGVAWMGVLVSPLRHRLLVAAACTLEAIVAFVWTLVIFVSATPCALSGRGPLIPTLQCPVQATHIVSAAVGGASCVALFTGVLAGLRYVHTGKEGSRRLFMAALLLGATLVLVWLAADVSLPRTAPSD